jgi:hypothetical protein
MNKPHWGQAYGTPPLFGTIEESSEGFFGDKAEKWSDKKTK